MVIMSASPSPVAAVAAAVTLAPSKWQRLVALARLLRDQLRRYREVAPVAGGIQGDPRGSKGEVVASTSSG